MAWLDAWDVIAESAFTSARARAVVTYLAAAGEIAELVEVRRHANGSELVIIDMQTGSPQRRVVEIERVERTAIGFPSDDVMPVVLMLREDFPDTEHQQLVPDGSPAAMCIDDRPWDEAQLTWTPAELVQRIHLWYRRAARGELHDPHQPIDPFFGLSRLQIVVPASVLSAPDGVELLGFVTTPDNQELFTVLPADQVPYGAASRLIIPVAYAVPPERMSRLRKAPRNLAALADLLKDRGVDVVADLKRRMRLWAGTEQKDRARLDGVLAIIVVLPVVAPNGSERPGILDLRVFMTGKTVGEIGVALGELHADRSSAAASGFARAVPARGIDKALLAGCLIEMAQVHRAFEPDWAAVLSGRAGRDPRNAVLVGAGAIGSHVAEYLAREGRFEWTVVDHDTLLPHNLARHTLRSMESGHIKAAAVAERLNSIFRPTTPSAIAHSIDADVLHPGARAEALNTALSKASVIIDASASVAASRHLADLEVAARRASVFFNPSATAVVALVEPQDRSLTLRDLEAQYYRAVLQRPELERHLTAVGERFAYTGACRAVTNRVPASQIALLSSLGAIGLSHALDQPEGLICVWSTDADGQVTVSKPGVAPITRYAMLDWEITVDANAHSEMRNFRDRVLPGETGGSVIGVIDGLARKIHVVEAMPAPPDSRETLAAFERGIGGLSEAVVGKLTRTMDQVRYVGEWHSHPPGYPVTPSSTDIIQLCQSTIFSSLESLPSLSFIVGDGKLNLLVGDRWAKS